MEVIVDMWMPFSVHSVCLERVTYLKGVFGACRHCHARVVHLAGCCRY